MAYTDVKGLTVSTTSSEALQAYEQGIDSFLRWRGNPMDALETAVAIDPDFILAHCARALIAWRIGRVDLASTAHEQIMTLADHIHDERENLHVQAIDALQQGERPKAFELLEQTSAQYPTDRLAVRILGLNCIQQGNYAGAIPIAQRSLDANPDEPQFMTMLGFFLEQSGYNEDGLAMSSRSLALDPTNLYTYHAVGHAYQARGDYRKTLETFECAASLEHQTHTLWHLAEARAILGYEQFTRDYWGSKTPILPLYERIELLWRLEMVQHTPTDEAIWKALAAEGERLLEHANALTYWMHHWIGLALARTREMDKAQRQLAYLRQLPEGRASGYWSTLGANLLEGEIAIMRGDYGTAVRLMAPAIEQIHAMGGGSREQKDIFKDTFLELHCRLGNTSEVVRLAQERLLQNPNHMQSLIALAWAYECMGDTALQRQTCGQLVRRAEAVGLHPETPALAEARQVLHATA